MIIGVLVVAAGLYAITHKSQLLEANKAYQAKKFRMLNMKNPFGPDSPWANRILMIWAIAAILIGVVFVIGSSINLLK